MEPETHQQRGQYQSAVGWKQAGNGQAESHYEYRQCGKSMLFDHHDDIDDQQGQKPRDLTHRLNDADVISIQPGNFHGKIIKQRQPGLQSNGGADG